MFHKNDKITLTLINARDINGNIIPFILKLPINGEYTLPNDLAAIDVYEYHEGLVNGGNIAFSIYIGELTTINELIINNTISNVKIINNIIISSLNKPLCIQNILDKKVIFGTPNIQDIVVDNKEHLIEVIEQLSNHFNIINNSINKIRTLKK